MTEDQMPVQDMAYVQEKPEETGNKLLLTIFCSASLIAVILMSMMIAVFFDQKRKARGYVPPAKDKEEDKHTHS